MKIELIKGDVSMFELKLPRVKLCQLPTNLGVCSKPSEKLGNVNIYFKRDDNTGLFIGGNKGRKLEFLLADAINKGADVVITMVVFSQTTAA